MHGQLPTVVCLCGVEDFLELIKIFFRTCLDEKLFSEAVLKLLDEAYDSDSESFPHRGMMPFMKVPGSNIIYSDRKIIFTHAYWVIRMCKKKGMAKAVWIEALKLC
ncbi:MAG: hypothetical protein WC459_03680 [Patescibacteria group bacterium]